MRCLMLLGGFLLFSVFAIAACSGDDDGDSGDGNDQSRSQGQSEPSGLSEAEAEALARAALLVIGDLPDAEWEVEEFDIVDEVDAASDEDSSAADPNDPFAGIPECGDFQELTANDFWSVTDVEPTAIVARVFYIEGADGFSGVSVYSIVAVFNSVADARAVQDRFRQVLSVDTLKQCFEASLGDDAFGGAEIGDLEVEEPDDKADDGAGVRFRLEAELGLIAFNLLLEYHAFQHEFVGGIVMVDALNGDEIGDLEPGKLAQLIKDRLRDEIY